MCNVQSLSGRQYDANINMETTNGVFKISIRGRGGGEAPVHIKSHSNRPLYNNTVIGRLAVDGWA